MTYIFESHKYERGQQFEVFGLSDGSIDFDSIVNGKDSSVRLDRSEVIELVSALESWLDRTWSV